MQAHQYEALIANATFGYSYNKIILDSDGKPVDYLFLEVNPAFEKMLGKEPGTVQGKRVSEVVSPVLDDPFDWLDCFGEVALTGKSKEVEGYSVALRRGFRLSVSSPEKGFFNVLSFDITQSKLVELELIKSKETLADYIEHAPDGIFIADSSLRFIDVNPAACKMTGYTKQELLTLKISQILSDEDIPAHRKSIEDLQRTGKSSRATHFKKKDGTIVTIDIEVVTLKDSRYMSFCRDITEKEQTEIEKNRYMHAFRNTSQPVLITDANGVIVSVNDALLDMYGYTRDEMLGQNPRVLNPGREVYDNLGISYFEYETGFHDLWHSVLDPEVRTWKGELINKRKDSSLVWVSLLVNGVYDENNALQSIIGFPIDTTVSHEVNRQNRIELYKTIADLAELRDDDTGNHMRRVGLFAKIIAKNMGRNEKYCNDLEAFAPMHDIGKVGIPDSILLAPRRLTPEEFEIMKQHTVLGHNIVKGKKEFEMAAAITLCHHERYDGTGYPNGISGKHIPLSAQITALCDVYDALRSKRPYKEPWPHGETVAEIMRSSGTHFNPDMIKVFEKLHPKFESIYTALND